MTYGTHLSPQDEQRVKQRVVQGLTEESCCDAAEDITATAVASMCSELAREIFFNCRWAGDVATSIMIQSALAAAGRPLPAPGQLTTYSEAVEASSHAANMLRAVSQISRRNRGRLTVHTLSMPSRRRSNGSQLPYHVHTPPPAVPVLNLYVAHAAMLQCAWVSQRMLRITCHTSHVTRHTSHVMHVRAVAASVCCSRHRSQGI